MKRNKVLNLISIFIFMILCMFLFTGCTSVNLDTKNKISEDEILSYVEKYCSDKYSKEITGQFYQKNDLIYSKGFSFLGEPTGARGYNVEGGKKYKFLMTDSDGVSFVVDYSDAYYVYNDGEEKYVEQSITDDYENQIKDKIEADEIKESALYYFNKDTDRFNIQYMSYHFDESNTLKLPKTSIYLDYSTDDITNELLGKLFKLFYGYRNDRYTKEIVLRDKEFLFDNFDELFKQSYKDIDLDENISINNEYIYNDFCSFLDNNTDIKKDNINSLATEFLKVAQYFITDDNYEFEKSISNGLLECIKVICKTQNGEEYLILCNIIYDEENNEYKIKTIKLSESNTHISRMPVFDLYLIDK